MKNETQNQKSWLDNNGQMLTDENLKEVSKSWSAETWEQFLSSTVDRDMSSLETTVDNFEELLEQTSEGIAWGSSSKLPIAISRRIQEAMRLLTKQQKQILQLHFWGEMSERQIAQYMEISQQTVHVSKKSSLSKIKDFLENDAVTQSYLIGGSKNSKENTGTREQQIREVYLMDLQGSYMK